MPIISIPINKTEIPMKNHYREAVKHQLEVARRLMGESSEMRVWLDTHTAIATIRTVMTYDPECTLEDVKVITRLAVRLLRRGLK